MGTIGGVMRVQREISPLLPKGYATDLPSMKEEIKKADDQAAVRQRELDGMLNKKKDEFDLSKDIADRQHIIALTQATINSLDKDSVEYHQQKSDLIQQQIDLQKDLNQQSELEKQNAEATAKWKKWSEGVGREFMRGQIASAMEDAVYPTVENLAGRSYMEQLNSYYGEAKYKKVRGRWQQVSGFGDLGAGDGPFSAVAQEYELAQKQQLWDRKYGNISDANDDRIRMNQARDTLIGAGVANPEMILGKIQDNTAALHTLWKSMVKNGSIKIATD